MTLTNLVTQYLKQNGPSLSSEVSEHLVEKNRLTPAAARQRVSRGGKDILRLELNFPRRAKFLFLKEQAGTGLYWGRLEKALLVSNSAYGYAIMALHEREGIMPKHHFEIACGSPVRQKKHLSASLVLQRLVDTNLIKEIYVEGVGQCIYLGLFANQLESIIPAMKARIFAEELVLRGLKSWMRKLGFVSYNQVNSRSSDENPKVSTTAWDLAGPSYLSPLVSFSKNESKPNPGFIVCDILLNAEVSERAIQPYLQKLNALRNLPKVGSQLCFFVANSFHENAFNTLKSLGISPATTSTIFDNDIGKGLAELINLLSHAAVQAIEPEKLDTLFNSLGKIEGAANRLRGAFFEFVIAEAMRGDFGFNIQMNRLCQTQGSSKEADVICVSNTEVFFIEGKGYSLSNRVTLDAVEYWLTQQVPVFRKFALSHPDWRDKSLRFEFWTTGYFDDDALARLEKAKQNTTKYCINYKDLTSVSQTIKNTGNKALIKTFSDHFASHPLNYLK
ncbi:nuclease-related domain-containing protein [Shewanella algae]|uniref:nuclease-related domain-containing protein n=1 Tax=Shewanella algae TaxID=38313 RepID=UPI0021BD17D9|nr:nuclease-related domain-containing protein [Shewanella algae]